MDTPVHESTLIKYRGEIGTIVELDVEYKRVGRGATALAEYRGILFPADYLIPIDDDHEEAFDRFIKKLDLGNPSYSPWTEKA